MATIRLTSQVEILSGVLRISSEESLDECPHFDLNTSLVGEVVGIGIRISSASWLIDPADSSHVVPRRGVRDQSLLVGDGEGSVFEEKSELRAAAGTTSEPEDDGIGGGIVL